MIFTSCAPALRVRPLRRALTALCTCLLLSSVALPACASDTRAAQVNFSIEGTVIEVEDGDTLSLRGGGGGRFHIRLSDLDAPEVAHGNNPYRERRSCRGAPHLAPGQLAGEAAREALSRRAPRKAAARAECYTIDRYGRPVCHVFVGATNLNLEQLRDGWAMLLTRRSWIRDPASSTAEQAARAARRGIWATARPLRPDMWRAHCWCRGVCDVDER